MKNVLTNLKSVFCLVFIMTASILSAQNYDGQTLVSKAIYLGKSKPLSELLEVAALDKEKLDKEKANLPRKFFPNFRGKTPTVAINKEALPQGSDAVWQKSFDNIKSIVIEPLVNIEGMSNDDSFATPPDPTGAIGKNHYVQMVNSTLFQIFDKQGNELSVPMSMTSFWAQFGRGSGGDPIVLYDQGADRWVFTEFPPFQNYLLIAVSETSDPFGTWNAYEFSTPSFPDYPKYAVWNNSYIVTSNEGGDIPVYLLEREKMLNGEDANVVRLTVPRISTGPGFQVVTPVNWSGKMPPSSSLNPMILRMVDDAWGTTAEDKLEVWSVDVDWSNPASASISNTSSIVTTPFDSYPCAAATGGFACVPQPNGNQGVDSQVEIIMNQVHYRNFGSHESVVLNFIADATGGDNLSGIRWFELRKSSITDWDVYQEGTYAPDDGEHRYMGGIAIDASGNIGLGLSLSSSNTFPSLAFTGRRSQDTLGQMTIEEYRIVDGLSNTGSRYGDYAHLTVDPENERTFWYTGEYMTDGGNWSTRIFSFEMRDTLDMRMARIIEPLSASSLSMEMLTVEIVNAGIDSVEMFDVSYSINGGPFIMEHVDSLLKSDNIYRHTFGSMIDLEAFGIHNIRCVVTTENDKNALNDTLDINLTKYFLWDAGVTNILKSESVVCDDSTIVNILIKNYSDINLETLRLFVEQNGIITDSIDWNGNLGFEKTNNIEYEVKNLIGGINDLSVFSAFPNGIEDMNPANDSQSTIIELLENAITISLNLQLDFYPIETSWAVLNENGDELFSGGNYSEIELIIEEFCLDRDACYTLEIYDSFGDGLNGQAGTEQGYYNLIDDQGIILAAMNEVNFGSVAAHNFCATFMCNLSANIDVAPPAMGSDNGIIIIDPIDGVAPFSYSIDGGLSSQDQNTFNNIADGMYEVYIMDANGCIYTENIEVLACTMEVLIMSTNSSGPNNTDGSIELLVTGATEPIQYSINGGQSFNDSNIFNNLIAGVYNIEVIDANGCVFTFSSFMVDFTSAVVENSFGRNIKIYPNPTNGLFTIEVKDVNLSGTDLYVHILDINGKKLTQSKLTRYNDFYTGQISILTYPSGTYLIRFVNKDLKTLIKLIKE